MAIKMGTKTIKFGEIIKVNDLLSGFYEKAVETERAIGLKEYKHYNAYKGATPHMCACDEHKTAKGFYYSGRIEWVPKSKIVKLAETEIEYNR